MKSWLDILPHLSHRVADHLPDLPRVQRCHDVFATGVSVSFVDSRDLGKTDGVIGLINRDFLPRALAEGQFVPAPEPLIAGTGIEKIQDAMEMVKKGVSARKVIVTV